MIYAFLRWLMRTIVHVYLAGLFELRGIDNIPTTGPVILCPNHAGTIDPPLVPAFVPRADTWSMAKSEYFRRPLIRFFFTRYNAFPVVRHTADRGAIKRSFDLLKDGHILVIYPEGTRIDSGMLARPEPGAGFIAQRAGCQVVPVALTGTRECLPKGARWPRRVRVTLSFGRPFTIATRRADGTRVSHEAASEAIMAAIAEMLPEQQRGEFSDLDGIRRRLAGVVVPS